ncbi:Inosine-uridine nucleoside N-ribohydrolase [Thermanaerovibrio velox DSM 12556]|uniref:Inosine-uridine nucleoside N-ribohydrolase n=1 Tax=Thermanaerovibrio velox DSM 12556 TaxID=926567 RepID=H0UN77_9BACT|nr:nucleoside hydrolase [Thermanaerovibrio velox]EHM10362.1 Inosine-uridine nucleoside N-ribohydrolase [Thermanaerovibrio velox DSM 12556]
MQREKIILDVDPGHDDAVAMMMAGSHPSVELMAVTVVAGNQTLDKTVKNALNVASVLGLKDVPVAAGMSRPMVREQIIADDIHGVTGLDGPKFDEPTVQQDPRHGVDLIIETLMGSDGDITIVPTGPLTNVAMAIRKEPRIVEKIKRIVLMGGSYQLGNVTPSAEFNIYADPEAAHVVFSSGRPIVMMGLDLTRQVRCSSQVIERIGAIGNRVSKLFVELMEFFSKTQEEIFGWDAPPLHDPTTVAYVIDPSIFVTKPMRVDVELRGEHTYGRTCCDYFGVTKKEPNAQVAVTLDLDRFWDLLEACIRRYS